MRSCSCPPHSKCIWIRNWTDSDQSSVHVFVCVTLINSYDCCQSNLWIHFILWQESQLPFFSSWSLCLLEIEYTDSLLFLFSVSADKWPVMRTNKQQRKSKGNIFVLLCCKESALKLIFSYNFGNLNMLQSCENCFSEFITILHASMVHAIIHCAHQGILHGTYKHSLHTITNCVVHTNIHIEYHNILHGTYKHSLHTIAYCFAHTKHLYCTVKHIALHTRNIHIAHQFTRLNLSFEVCHLCVRFHIVRSFNTYEAHSARHVSTTNQFCCRRQQNMTFRTLYL